MTRPIAFVAAIAAAAVLCGYRIDVARAAAPAATPTATPDYVAAVGPLHGSWTVDGKPALLGEPLVAGASIREAQPGAPGSIAIYSFDGRLFERTCPPDPACAGPFGLEPLGDTASTEAVMRDATKALPHYRFVAALPVAGAANATPADGIAPLGTDGSVEFGEIMRGVPQGPYRLVVRPLDPHAGFVPAGDPIFKLFTWNGDPVSVVVGGIPEGLYQVRLFARDAPDRALGAPAWAAVIPARDVAIAGFRSARDIAAKWTDPEAKQIFLRSYLVDSAFPQSTPGPRERPRRHER